MRCGMDLDEIDPAKWSLLEAATEQYIAEEDAAFDSCARLLVHHMADTRGRLSDVTRLALGMSLCCSLHCKQCEGGGGGTTSPEDCLRYAFQEGALE